MPSVLTIPEISKQIYNNQTLSVLEETYSKLVPQWTISQLEWMNGIYKSFKDHEKFLIIIYLTKRTLDFYARNFVKLSYNDFYSKNSVEIEKFSVIEISKELNIPKESARRKIIELENEGVIKRYKKKIIIERSAHPYSKPEKTVLRISRFLSMFSKILKENKAIDNDFSTDQIEKNIKKNFSYIWKLYYEMQIPMILNYKKIFGDIETFHIYGSCVVNQHLYTQETNNNMNRAEFLDSIITTKSRQGLNAMSISEITGIPRATVVRKLKKLVKSKSLFVDEKKHYKLTSVFIKKLIPVQKNLFIQLANFTTKVINTAIL